MRELIFINTLGLTGSEFIAAALSDTAGVRLLPGLYAMYNPMPYGAACEMEVELGITKTVIK